MISTLEPPKNVAVRDRVHPEYAPKGIRLGSLIASPRYAVTGEYVDNLLATENAPESDYSIDQTVSLGLATTWSRHAATALAALSAETFLDNQRENNVTGRVQGGLRLDVTRDLNVEFRGGYAEHVEERTESVSRALRPREPIEFAQTDLSVAVTHRMPRMRLTLKSGYRHLDYENAVAQDGTPILQNNRDRDVLTISARNEVAISPDMFVLVEGAGNWRQFDEPSGIGTPKRDSSGYEILTGAGFALSDVIRGEVAAGYFEQTYDDEILGSESGVALRANADWYLTQLMTLSLGAGRAVHDADLANSPQRVATTLSASLDYEIFRNLVLSGGYGYTRDSFDRIDRTDVSHAISASLVWLINRYMEVDGRYGFEREQSSGTNSGSDYEINRVSATWRLRF